MAINVDAKDIANTVKTISVNKISCAAALLTGALLFLPDKATDILGLTEFRSNARPYLGFIFLGAIVILVVSLGSRWIKKRRLLAQYSGKGAKKKLDELSNTCKAVVRDMYESPSHSKYLPPTSAVANYLESSYIIGRGSIGTISAFDYYLEPWVVSYLDKHPQYLEQMPRSMGNDFVNDDW